MMFALFFLAASGAVQANPPASQPAPAAPAESVAHPATARDVVMAQLRSAPRTDVPRGLSAEEADAVYKRYLASIGQRLERNSSDRDGGGQ